MTVAFDRPAAPLASVVVVTYGGWTLTREALEALVAHTPEPFEVVIVDNDSPDDTAERIRAEVSGATLVFNDRNVGFGQAANQGARLSRGRFLVFLNSDAMVRPGWLRALTDAIDSDPRAGAAVPRYLDADGTVQEAGGLLFRDGSTLMWGHGATLDDPAYRFPRYVDYGSAACLVVRRSLFRAAGGFDAAYRPMYVEDVDLALALRARGFRTVYEPRAEVVHARFGSSGGAEERARRLVERNTPILRERWREVLARRPPFDLESPARLLGARDADAAPRVAVLGGAAAAAIAEKLASRFRSGRVTFAMVSDGASEAALELLLDAGVEVVPDVADAEAWLASRPFHYDAIVIDPRSGTVDPQRAHQPTAVVLRPGPDASADQLAGQFAAAGILVPAAPG